MDSMHQTIRDYEAGCEQLTRRIRRLSRQIAKAGADAAPLKSLIERRQLLYLELTQMQYALREMRGYLDAVCGTNGKPAAHTG